MTSTPREPDDTAYGTAEDTTHGTAEDTTRGTAEDTTRGTAEDTTRGTAGDGTEDTPVRLLQADELQAVVSKWREIQAEFVDQPKRAMQEADELVSELMDRLTRTFAEQREQLEARWSESATISTEELRQGLQRYRSFFERLLAA